MVQVFDLNLRVLVWRAGDQIRAEALELDCAAQTCAELGPERAVEVLGVCIRDSMELGMLARAAPECYARRWRDTLAGLTAGMWACQLHIRHVVND